MTFCGGIMSTNTEPLEGTGVNSRRRETPQCYVNVVVQFYPWFTFIFLCI